MGSLARLLDQCRRAKENLSAVTVTTVPAVTGEDVELSRNDFEELISGPLDQFVATVEDVLQRNDIPKTNLAAVAIVGGGAAVPLLTTRLAERLEVPIHTAPQPGFSAAIGAATFGQQHPAARVAASPPVENPTQLASAAPADMTQMLPGARIEEEAPWPGRRTKTRTILSPTPDPNTAANMSGTQWNSTTRTTILTPKPRRCRGTSAPP